MTRPEDIPADVWDEYRSILSCSFKMPIPGPEMLILVCRAAIAYGQRRADEATERAAMVCEEQASAFLSPEYAGCQPMSSLAERFACSECATAIRSQK